MKILIFSRGIPSNRDPQEGCFEWDQAKALAKCGHEVIIMAVDGRVRKYWRKIGFSSIEKDNIKAYKVFFFPTAIIRRIFSMKIGYKIEAMFAKSLYNHIIKLHGEFDIIHSHYLTSTYLATQIKQSHECTIIATEHWSELKRPKLSKEVQYLGNNSYKYVNQLISVSKDLGIAIKKHFNKDFLVIHNLIDTTLLKPALNKTNNEFFTIIAVGSLYKIKGFDILIKAFGQSYLKQKKVILKIIGEGCERNCLRKLITDNKLENQIFLCGQKNKEEVFDELHNADLFVLSSRSENFSVALIEATANGLPAVATLCGGIEEYPVDCIYKVPVEDINALAKGLEYAYREILQIDREQIQKQTLQNFSPDIIASKLLGIYNKTLSYCK